MTADSREARDFLWLGQVAALAGEKQEAEKAFRRACELNDQAPENWALLVLYLVGTDRKAAEAELERARTKLPADKAALALAPCLEALGKTDKAEEQYLKLLNAQPEDPGRMQTTAAFYARTGQPAKAEPLLRQVLAPGTRASPAAVVVARRALALVLALQGGYPRLLEAQNLVKQNIKANGETPADRQIIALVLATHPAHRKEAIRQVEGLAPAGATLPAEARYLLAQLHEADGNWSKAEAYLRELLEMDERNAQYLTRLVTGLLRDDQAKEAEKWLQKLAEVAPDKLETTALRFMTLRALKKTKEATTLVRNYARGKDARLDLVGRWFELLDLQAEAEKALRDFVLASKSPDTVLLLTQYLARQKRLDEALQLCDGAWKTCAPEAVAAASVTALRVGKGAPPSSSVWSARSSRRSRTTPGRTCW